MSGTDQPVVAEAQKCPTCGSAHGHSWYRCAKSKSTEPVATLPACLCGLDTNPVASPRMDIFCPKHDVPEFGGEPESLISRNKVIEVLQMFAPPADYSKDVNDDPGWGLTRTIKAMIAEIERLETRDSQPADEPSDGPLLTREQYQEQCKRPFYPGRDIHRYVGSKAPGQACETCDLSWVHENHGRMISMVAAAQPSPTPADEETVLRMISDSLSLDSLEILPARELKVLQDRITTALAEARRVGTPTTDARAGAWSKEFPSTNGWYWLRGFRQYRDLPCWVEDGRVYMMFSTHMFNRADFIEDGGEWRRMVKPDASAFSSTPSEQETEK